MARSSFDGLRTRAVLPALLLWIGACAGSADPDPCPDGTYPDEGECVAEAPPPEQDAEPTELPDGDDDDGASDPESDGWDDPELPPDPESPDPPAEVENDPEPPAPDPVEDDPAGPTFPATIGRLSFAIRTGAQSGDQSDAQMKVCLTATRCFKLDVPAVDDFRRGEFDVYHYANVDLRRSQVDRVEIRHVSGGDSWHPVCIETGFDGEPVQCAEGLPRIGTEGGQARNHRMPLRNDCGTCYPARITHGPLVGAVGPNDAQIWLRTDATRPVSLRIVRAAAPGEVVTTVGPRWPRPANDYTQVFEVTGLSPRTEYIARVRIGDQTTSREARFRTAPRDGVGSRFQVALGSCSNNHNVAAHPIFDVIRRQDPEMFVFLGDNHYGNTGNIQAHWWNYRDVLGRESRERMVSTTSTLAIWDDHDFTGNNSTRHADGRDRALRAFRDYWANGAYGTAETPGIFSRHTYGDVDFFLLDTRYHRDNPNTGGSILGAAQHRWLENQLQRSTAAFKIIASGSLFSRNGGETWLDYASRARLFRFIREQNIRGVVFLSGDIHHSSLRWIERDHYDIPEIVASGLANAENSSCHSAPPDYRQVACVGNRGSFALLDIDTTLADPRIVARLIDENGERRGSMEIRRSRLR